MSAPALLNFLEQKYDKVAEGNIPHKLILTINQRIKTLEKEFRDHYRDELNRFLEEFGAKTVSD